MDLHYYSGAQPEWAHITPAKRNRWQRLAAKTDSLVTPGNVVTIAGFALVLIGLVQIAHGALWSGLVLIALGRLCDILDGTVASLTGTKGPVGERLDATCDKFATFAILVILAATLIIWWPVALIILLYHICNSVLAILAWRRGITLHPRLTGKLSMFGQGTALLGLVLNAALRLPGDSLLAISCYVLIAIALGVGLYATSRYVRIYTRAAAP